MNQAAVSRVLADLLPYPLIGILAFNMVQRRYLAVGEGKRFATLYVAGLLVVLLGSAYTFAHFRVPDAYLLLPLAVTVFAAWRFRARVWPFRLRCRACHARLSWRRVLFYDDQRCPECTSDNTSPMEDAE